MFSILSNDVIEVAKTANLSPSDVGKMVKQASRFSHALGNRRYYDWIFQIEGNRVTNMVKMQPLDKPVVSPTITLDKPLKADEFIAYDECSACYGEGCEACGFEGEVRVVRKITKPRFGVMS